MRVLLADADAARAAGVAEELKSQYSDVHHVATADGVIEALASKSYRALIIDGEIDGGPDALTLRVRANGDGLPIIVLTDNPEPSFKITLLDNGVDDVVLRPYPAAVLPAQIRALLRRCAPFEGAVLKFEDLSLDLRTLQVMRQGVVIASTSRELAVLEYLMRNCQRVISRRELAEAIWDEQSVPGSNVIEVFIARLRRKVDRPFAQPLIHTIVGRGYMLSSTKPSAAEITPIHGDGEAATN